MLRSTTTTSHAPTAAIGRSSAVRPTHRSRRRPGFPAVAALVILATVLPAAATAIGDVGPLGSLGLAAAPAAAAPAPGFGELRVTTSPAVASVISVDGVPRDAWGLTWLDIEAGEHEVCFSDVLGFATPACETVVVPDGGTGTVEGQFTQLAALQVSTSPALPATIRVNGIERDDWGVFSWVEPNATATVCFGPVEDYLKPTCQQVPGATLTPGSFTQVTGAYTYEDAVPATLGTGFLRVTTTPALPSTISIDGLRADDWGLDWLKLDPGSYEVCFSDVAGHATPDCETAVVTAGATTVVDGQFTPLGYIRATTAPPWEATVEIDGVARNDWGSWLPIEAGPHEVCFTSKGLEVSCHDVTVTPGQTTEVEGAPPVGDPVIDIDAGSSHNCALRLSGTVVCWGRNNLGQLGDGTTTSSATPVQVVGLVNATSISAFTNHTCATVAGSAPRCWGYNFHGQLGDGTTTNSSVPVRVTGFGEAATISAGGAHTCATKPNGNVWCWGRDLDGVLGNGVGGDSPSPVQVVDISTATSVSVNAEHSCARLEDGTIRCWGSNRFNRVGVVPPENWWAYPWLLVHEEPVTVLEPVGTPLSNAVSIETGLRHTCVTLTDGTLSCWGDNERGQIAQGPMSGSVRPDPVPTASGVVDLGLGDYHTCAVGDLVWCWGANDWGQLFEGPPAVDWEDETTPVTIDPLPAAALKITAGFRHTCALVNNGSVHCWGINDDGQLGRGTESLYEPVGPVIGL